MKSVVLVQCCALVVLLVAQSAFSSPLYEYEEQYVPDNMAMAKRGFKPVPFPCNGYDSLPRCLHGGKGPRKTWTKSGRFCVCLCPTKWIGPECSYAADTLGM